MNINCNSCKHESLLYSDNPCKSCVSYCNFESNLEEKARVEAIKEFAYRLRQRSYKSSDWSRGEHPMVIEWSDIEDVLEEMVGDSE